MAQEENSQEDLIIKYLDGELSMTELEHFNEMMSSNPNFAAEVEKYRYSVAGINKYGKNEISQIVNKISDNKSEKEVTNKQNSKIIKMNTHDKSNTRRQSSSKRPWLMAASMAFLLAAGFYWYTSQNATPDYDKLYAEYAKPQVESSTAHLKNLASQNLASRGIDPTDTMTVMFFGERMKAIEAEAREKARRESLMSGIKQFNDSKWDKARVTFYEYSEKYADKSEDHALATFYLAKSSMNNGDYADAIARYNDFLNMGNADEELKEVSEWDRAISYLQIDQSKVKNYLEDIAHNNKHAFQDEAKGLLAYLD